MRTDILLDANFDLQYNNGELVRGESTAQHQLLLLVCNKGDFKRHPTSCVGAYNFLKDTNNGALLQEIKKEFERDGMAITSLKIIDGSVHADANYAES
jgi:hypothetical protein